MKREKKKENKKGGEGCFSNTSGISELRDIIKLDFGVCSEL